MASKKIVSAAAAVATVAATLSPAFAANFTDVKSDATYAKSANRLKALGIVSGDAKGNFNPDDNLQRDQAAKLLVGALAQNNAAAGENKFSDVSGWATKFVNIAAAQGYVKGYGNGKFGPADKVTNGQFLAMALRALGKDDAALGLDAKTKWADKVTKYLAAAKDAKLIDGLDNLDPAATAKRSDVAVIVNNLLNSDVDGSTLYENVKKDLGVQVVNGTVDSVDANTVVVAGKAYTADTVPDKVKAGAIVKFDAKDDTAVSDITVVKEAQTVVNANYNVVSVAAVDNTHVAVTFDNSVATATYSQFGFDGGLVATDAKVDKNVVTLTTSAQTADKYVVTYNGKVAGAFTGIAPKEIVATDAPVAKNLTVVNPDKTTVSQDVTVAGSNYSVKSVQAIVGGTVTATAKTTAGATLTFKVMSPNGSLNTQYSKDVVADANGIATFSYSRTSADTDTIIIAAKGNESKQDIVKVYWGINQPLTITSDNSGSTTNGGVVTYTVSLKNPVTGEAMPSRNLRVLFLENVGKEGTSATAMSMNSGEVVRPYQDINGTNSSLVLKTDSTGVAKFQVSGNLTTATPVVFYDDPTFYGQGLYDSTQYLASFAGNSNGKFDPIELNVVGKPANFVKGDYTITATEDGTTYMGLKYDYLSGRTYTITVNKGATAYAGGVVNVGFNELLGSTYKDTRARIIAIKDGSDNTLTPKSTQTIDGKIVRAMVRLDGAGKFKITIASDRPNTEATPIVWVDQDTPSLSDGLTNALLDSIDFSKVLDKTIFIDNALSNGAKFVVNPDEKGNAQAVNNNKDGYDATFRYSFLDNLGNVVPISSFGSDATKARFTYVVQNTGNKYLKVTVPDAYDKVTVDQIEYSKDVRTFVLAPGTTRTIAFTVTGAGVDHADLYVDNNEYVNEPKDGTNAAGAVAVVSANAQILTGAYSANAQTEVYSVVKYTAPSSAITATWGTEAVKPTEVNLDPGTYVGTILKDGTNTNNNVITLLLPNNRIVEVTYKTGDIFKAGKKTTISTTDKLTANDFTQATTLSADKELKTNKDNTALKKFEAALKSDDSDSTKNSAVMVKWNAVGPNEFTALYPDYNTDRVDEILGNFSSIGSDYTVTTTASTSATTGTITIPNTADLVPGDTVSVTANDGKFKGLTFPVTTDALTINVNGTTEDILDLSKVATFTGLKASDLAGKYTVTVTHAGATTTTYTVTLTAN